MSLSPCGGPYAAAFTNESEPFIWSHDYVDGSVHSTSLTRGEFLDHTRCALEKLTKAGLRKGSFQVHWFHGNHLQDLAFRLAASLLGSVPVTLNWQADDVTRIIYKIRISQAKVVIDDGRGDPAARATVAQTFPGLVWIDPRNIGVANQENHDEVRTKLLEPRSDHDPKMVIFTSGTTGQPKGVLHGYGSYRTNGQTFDQFLACQANESIQVVVVNPLHHTNATAMTDWAMRRPGAVIHLFERYGSAFWSSLAEIASRAPGRTIVPLVARHIDFLANLVVQGRLGVALPELKASLKRTVLLLGSAPVGPSTVARLDELLGCLPTVRFGSTETCLQVMGIPQCLRPTQALTAFERGWHEGGESRVGYYLGRPHEPLTQVRVVVSVDPQSENFLKPCLEGEPGFLICRGGNLMQAYLGQPEATAAVMHNGWYTGLLDVGFYLVNREDGEADYYWMSRESTLLIRGGANYAYDQIADILSAFTSSHFDLGPDTFKLAVIGMRLTSEHEDACCVTIQDCSSGKASLPEPTIWLAAAREAVPKFARPDHLRYGPIPLNFKGAVQVPELRVTYEAFLKTKAAEIAPEQSP